MKMTTEYKNMLKFGQDVFLEGLESLKKCKAMVGINQRNEIIRTKRLALVNCVHGIELILKAILLKKGYVIYKWKQGIFKNDSPIAELQNQERTIDLNDVLEFFRKNYPELDTKGLKKLKSLRNQIVHHGVKVDEKKKEYFIQAIDFLKGLYDQEQIRNRTFLGKINVLKTDI